MQERWLAGSTRTWRCAIGGATRYLVATIGGELVVGHSDVEVEYSAEQVLKGRDPQLDRAVQEALKLLEQAPNKRVPRPAPIDRASKEP